jgi:hypothetical protein
MDEEAIIMSTSTIVAASLTDDDAWADAVRSAAAFLAGFRSPDTRKGYRRDLQCWLEFCIVHELHPYIGASEPRRGVPAPARGAGPGVSELDATAPDLDAVVVVPLRLSPTAPSTATRPSFSGPRPHADPKDTETVGAGATDGRSFPLG